jgi:hypothetical protein
MKKALRLVVCIAVLGVSLSGCYTLKHEVGTGAAGGASVSETQWYVLWGLVPLGKVDSKAMAGGAANYTVVSEHTFVDILVTIITQYVSVVRQTVTVTK